MRLAEFIKSHRDEIIAEWVTFARGLGPPASEMNESELRDHAEEILTAVAGDMAEPQTEREQTQKSKGQGHEHSMKVVGRAHASQRIGGGFKLAQVVAEYRALRATVLRLWLKTKGPHNSDDMIRFNEAIDETLTESAVEYTAMVDRTREHFLAVLGHDLRNPLGAIIMSATLMSQAAHGEDKRPATIILNSTQRMMRLVDDLLDLTRARLGTGIPIKRDPADLGVVCRQVVAEIEAAHPKSKLHYRANGDLRGVWDGDRLAQVVSNVVANAVQYGSAESPVEIVADGSGDEVVLTVRNAGAPIPPEAIATIFEPMTRLPDAVARRTAGTGLGLFIVREVVSAHGGTIDVNSSASEGTTFTMRLPRRPDPEARLS